MITINEMTEAAQRLVAAEKATAEAEAALKEAKERERFMREETLPGMMQELGVEKMTLTDGNEITVKPEVYCSITEYNRSAAFAWLESNEGGGIIKTQVSVPFGKGELQQAIELVEKLNEQLGVDTATIDRAVHPQTLKAFLKERLADPKGEDDFTPEERAVGKGPLPLETFSARYVQTAKIKMKK